jgi:hypothetical protein
MKHKPREVQNNLENWDNRVRSLIHEITHLDYFMDAPKKVPLVWDLEVYHNKKWKLAYGPWAAKKTARYIEPGENFWSGYFSQRNADNFAWFAMAKYIESQIGFYPTEPKVFQRLQTMPRNSLDGQVPDSVEFPVITEEEEEESEEGEDAPWPDTNRGGCPDRM